MNKSKQAKTSERVDGVDRVSNLPDPILHLILSGIPATEEIIRSSVLSRRWRYLWTSIPRVDIDYSRGLNPVRTSERNKLKEYKFTEFVYWVFLKSSLNLDSFRLCCGRWFSKSTVGRWISAAVTRNIKQLHLEFRPPNPTNKSRFVYEKIEMPHCLVTCCSLEVLRLSLLKGPLFLPKYTGFPSLRVLELNGVELLEDADVVKAFFTSCPLLEDLTLIDCDLDTLEFLCISSPKLKYLRIDNHEMLQSERFYYCCDLQISCPNLVFLELVGPMALNFFFNSLNSLKKAVIHPKVVECEPESDIVCELFARISNVESLSISLSFVVEKCFDPEVDVPISLPNIKTLELTLDHGSVNHALQFLKIFPNLESFHLNIIKDSFTAKCLKEATTRRIFTRQLKRVVFVQFYGDKQELKRACFFLKHGKVLEEMVFCWANEAKLHERSKETMSEVSNFHKASPTVKLIELLKPWAVHTTFVVQRD